MEGSRIFISYRRQDSPGFAGRIADHLDRYFGEASVFRDVEAIEYGTDFVIAIDRAVTSCALLVVVIGNAWMTVKDAQGRRRLENEDDFVRLEVATALKRGIRVIPVLVQGASPPKAEELPADLQAIARRQAIEISDERFGDDMERLIRAVESGLEKAGAGDLLARRTVRKTRSGRPDAAVRWKLPLIAGGTLAVLLGGGWALFARPPQAEPAIGPTPTPPGFMVNNGSMILKPNSPAPAPVRATGGGTPPVIEPPPQAVAVDRVKGPATKPRAPVQKPAAPAGPSVVSEPVRAAEPPVADEAAQDDQPSFDPAGTWEGTWSDPRAGQNGRLKMEIAGDGSVSGWLGNDVVQRSYPLTGRITKQLQLLLTCQCEPVFNIRGSLRPTGTASARGHLDLTTPDRFLGRSQFVLARSPTAR
jgi:hypothetical protein